MSIISAEQARKLYDAEMKVKDLRLQLEAAEQARNNLRARYRPSLIEVADFVTAGGIKVKVTQGKPFKVFDFGTFKEEIGILAPMDPYMGKRGPIDRWTVKKIPV